MQRPRKLNRKPEEENSPTRPKAEFSHLPAGDPFLPSAGKSLLRPSPPDRLFRGTSGSVFLLSRVPRTWCLPPCPIFRAGWGEISHALSFAVLLHWPHPSRGNKTAFRRIPRSLRRNLASQHTLSIRLPLPGCSRPEILHSLFCPGSPAQKLLTAADLFAQPRVPHPGSME